MTSKIMKVFRLAVERARREHGAMIDSAVERDALKAFTSACNDVDTNDPRFESEAVDFARLLLLSEVVR